jgi:radical SAM superfamily enzyme YgiQ (UPF0313 family)|tara:strand:- start:2885 stop:4408 length:1524 start_codon:yes stop_codon:yes gene_type:complete
MYVSSAVKAEGHDTHLFHFSPFKDMSVFKNVNAQITETFIKTMEEYQPDIVGFTVIKQDYRITKNLSSIVKDIFKTTVVWGGIEPILESEMCIKETMVDYICTGEAELAFPEFLRNLQNGQEFLHDDRLRLEIAKESFQPEDSDCETGSKNEKESVVPFPLVKGIWGKDELNRIIRTGRPRLVDDINAIPFPDREILDPEYYRAELTGANILTARGCPFPCTFCQNLELMRIFKGKGKFVRYRSFDSVFKEMEYLIENFNAPSFYFSDEMFTLSKKRVLEFCKLYKERGINKPFMVQTRLDCMDEELAEALADAGCSLVNMAIESGNEYLRNKILKKKFTEKQIIDAYTICHEKGMMTSSYNMIGIPEETIDNIWETININRKLMPDRIMCTIFMPMPGTDLWEQCKSDELEEYMSDATNYYTQVVYNHPNLSARTLIGFQGFFDWYVLLPRWTFPIIHVLRHMYAYSIPPRIPKNPFLKKIRDIIVEFVYQMKNYLPQKTLQVKAR